MQKTYVMIKPHFANDKIAIDEIKKRLLNLGLKITTENFIKYDIKSAQQHYAEHIGKSFYPEL